MKERRVRCKQCGERFTVIRFERERTSAYCDVCREDRKREQARDRMRAMRARLTKHIHRCLPPIRNCSREPGQRAGSADLRVRCHVYRIYGPEVQDPVEYWRVSTERTLALINDLLARAGSDERVYHLGGAEDGAAVFLTLTMVDVIHSSESLRDCWLPEQP